MDRSSERLRAHSGSVFGSTVEVTANNNQPNSGQQFEPLFPRLRFEAATVRNSWVVAYYGGRHGRNKEWRVEARICRDGSREAAGNRKQGRQGKPWRRAQERQQSLINVRSDEQAPGGPIRPALIG